MEVIDLYSVKSHLSTKPFCEREAANTLVSVSSLQLGTSLESPGHRSWVILTIYQTLSSKHYIHSVSTPTTNKHRQLGWQILLFVPIVMTKAGMRVFLSMFKSPGSTVLFCRHMHVLFTSKLYNQTVCHAYQITTWGSCFLSKQ